MNPKNRPDNCPGSVNPVSNKTVQHSGTYMWVDGFTTLVTTMVSCGTGIQ
jgi:hypothetical protein